MAIAAPVSMTIRRLFGEMTKEDRSILLMALEEAEQLDEESRKKKEGIGRTVGKSRGKR